MYPRTVIAQVSRPKTKFGLVLVLDVAASPSLVVPVLVWLSQGELRERGTNRNLVVVRVWGAIQR
jgi:hypothetical protein